MNNHTFQTRPVSATLGTEIIGIDLSHEIDPDTVSALRGLMHTNGLLLFRDQTIDEVAQVRFARYFGNISRQGPIQRSAAAATYVSNVRADGTFGQGELRFHSDQCYYRHPMKSIMLYGLEVPDAGGATLFANTAHVVRTLPDEIRAELGGYRVRHEFDYGALHYGADKKREIVAELAAAEHDAIADHPWSDQRVLMVNGETATALVGATPSRSRELIDWLNATVSRPENVYTHHWRVGDLLLWDNLLLQHARSIFDPATRRTLRRCAIAHEHEPAASP